MIIRCGKVYPLILIKGGYTFSLIHNYAQYYHLDKGRQRFFTQGGNFFCLIGIFAKMYRILIIIYYNIVNITSPPPCGDGSIDNKGKRVGV